MSGILKKAQQHLLNAVFVGLDQPNLFGKSQSEFDSIDICWLVTKSLYDYLGLSLNIELGQISL